MEHFVWWWRVALKGLIQLGTIYVIHSQLELIKIIEIILKDSQDNGRYFA
jgi:hypothetical protein